LSTANLYTAVQPGGSLFEIGLAHGLGRLLESFTDCRGKLSADLLRAAHQG